MRRVGISTAQESHVFQLLSAILHLSAVEFELDVLAGDQSARIKSNEPLLNAAGLLEVLPETLQAALTYKSALVGQMLTTDILNVEEAFEARDALCNCIYGFVVGWVEERCNSALTGARAGSASRAEEIVGRIAILDVPGLENRQVKDVSNGIFQFTSNYVAERVNETILHSEFVQGRQLLKLEGLGGAGPEPAYVNTTPCIQLISAPGTGIFALLDELLLDPSKNQLMGRRTSITVDAAAKVIATLSLQHQNSPFYSSSGGNSFAVNHYLNPISYAVVEVLKHNRTAVRADFVKVLTETRAPFLRDILQASVRAEEQVAGNVNSTIRGLQLRSKARFALIANENESTAIVNEGMMQCATHTAEVVSTLDDILQYTVSSRKWYVQCIRPDAACKPWRWSTKKVEVQVNGMQLPALASLHQRSGRLTVSMDYEQVVARYHSAVLGPETADLDVADDNVGRARRKVEALLAKLQIGPTQTKFGSSAIFFGEAAFARLEDSLRYPRLAQYVDNGGLYLEDADTNSQVSRSTIPAATVNLEKGIGSIPIDNVVAASDRGAAPGSNASKPTEKLTKDRRRWLRWVKFCTFWVPEVLLIRWGGMKLADVRLAWKEKFALVCIAFWMSAFLIFLVTAFGKVLCPTQAVYNLTELRAQTTMFTAINGAVYDLRSYQHTDSNDIYQKYAGGIADNFFPKSTALSQCLLQVGDPFGCGSSCIPSGWTAPPCAAPSSSGTATTYCHNFVSFYADVVSQKQPIIWSGAVGYVKADVAAYNSYDSATGTGPGIWGYVGNDIYDWSLMVEMPNLSSETQGKIRSNRGGDMSAAFAALPKGAQNCLSRYSRAGVIDTRNNTQCQASTYSLLFLTLAICAISAAKFLMALNISSKRTPEDQDRYVILQVPCYTEGEDSLRKTIDSLALLKYVDDRKLIFLICDGVIKGAGNDLSTPELVLSILGQEWDDRESFSFISIGEGLKQHNKARVYSGWYSIQARYIPYVVVVKCGSEAEIGVPKPGNRGKRDSQIILMKYLNKLHFNKPMLPLELELTRQIQTFIGVDPIAYEYCLVDFFCFKEKSMAKIVMSGLKQMVDADTEVLPDSLNRLIAVMLHDATIMGLCGETDISNEMDSWITMSQVYEYYISHHLAKQFESTVCFFYYGV